MTVVFVNADEIHRSWVGNIETGSPFHRKKPFNMDFGILVSDVSLVSIQKIHKTPIFQQEKPWIPGFRCGPLFLAHSKQLELPRMAETYRMITGDFSGQWSEEQRLIQVDPDSADWQIFSLQIDDEFVIS